MDWRRKRQIRNLIDGILEQNVLHRPPIELIPAIIKQRGLHSRNETRMIKSSTAYIWWWSRQKSSLSTQIFEHPANIFTIAHEFGHHYLGHPLQNGAIICDSDSVLEKNKPEQEKEADYFAACFLMPEKYGQTKTDRVFNHCPKQTTLFLEDQQLEQQHQLQRYLSDHFQVSMEAMGYRLDELKLG